LSFPILAACLLSVLTASGTPEPAGSKVELLNVSYDPTRELYAEFNAAFAKHWKAEGGDEVAVRQSHGGSGKQARAVIDGLEADVVTLALSYDIDAIAAHGKLVDPGWKKRLPHESVPCTSTIVFLVRSGNPKGIRDWPDLVRDGVKVITPNPKTSGGARWNYLAAWGAALKKELGDLARVARGGPEVDAAQEKAKAFVKQLFASVPVLDSGARAATTTFVQREIGDVLLAWESEAFLAVQELGKGKVEIVTPPLSIRAETPVALVDAVVDAHGTRKVAEAYLRHLFSQEGQAIVAKHGYRPVEEQGVPKESLARFPKVELFTIDAVFGGWATAQKTHFADGGVFDSIYAGAR
jgi:sulfate/thiosulfate transport system substrate-binding protein